jgi:hypothetical protein
LTRVRRTVLAALASAALVGVAVQPAAADGTSDHRHSRSEVALVAIRYDSPGQHLSGDRSLNSEWVKVANTTGRNVRLAGYTLTDRDGHRYTFGRLSLRPGHGVTVHTGHGRDSDRNVYQDRRRNLYDNGHGSITLADSHGRALDSCQWRPSDHGYKDCAGR